MKFKIRCSALGAIMNSSNELSLGQEAKMFELRTRANDPNGKPLTPTMEKTLKDLEYRYFNPELGAGAKAYLEQWFIEQKYGRRKEVISNVLSKGTECEEEAIGLLESFTSKRGFFKNSKQFANDYLTGEPDLIPPFEPLAVWDIKNAFDMFSYFKASREDPLRTSKGFTDYGWQGIGYLILTGRRVFHLAYCLINTPEWIINDEQRRAWFKLNPDVSDLVKERVEASIAKNHTFDDVPIYERVSISRMSFSEAEMQELKTKIQKRVELCQEYIDQLEELFNVKKEQWLKTQKK